MAPQNFFVRALDSSFRSTLDSSLRSTASSEKDLDNCAICLSEPEKPKALQCGHIFCQQCIEDLIKSGDDGYCSCPQCRTPLKTVSVEKLMEKSNAHFQKATALYLSKGKEAASEHLKRSIKALEHCLEMEPNNVQVLLQLANLVSDSDRKVSLYRRAVIASSRPLLDIRLKTAMILMRKDTEEHTKEAIEEFKKTIQASKGIMGRHHREQSHLALGSIYFKQGELDLAIQEFESVLKVNPKNTLAISQLASCYRKQGDDKKAIINYQKALKQEPFGLNTNLKLADAYERLLILNKESNLTHLSRDEQEAAFKAYLGCVLRAESVAYDDDMEPVQHHLEQIRNHFPTTWVLETQNNFFFDKSEKLEYLWPQQQSRFSFRKSR